jgi:hypothetical protein
MGRLHVSEAGLDWTLTEMGLRKESDRGRGCGVDSLRLLS